MNIYADYVYYKDEYGGSVLYDADNSNNAFVKEFREASVIIDQNTFDRVSSLDSVPEEVKNCCCELAEVVAQKEKALKQSSGKTSESVQGWSVSFQSRDDIIKEFKTQVRETIFKWLYNTGLLYAGAGD